MARLIEPRRDGSRLQVQGRLSYAHLWEPHSVPGVNNPKYSVAVLIPKSDRKSVEAVKAAVEAAFAEGIARFPKEWRGKRPVEKTPCLRDGDELDDPAYAGHIYFNASSKTKVPVLNRQKMMILDPEEIYSGCYGLVSVNFFPYATGGNNGVSCGLNAVLKTADGERLSQRMAEKDFDGMDLGPDDNDESLDDL